MMGHLVTPRRTDMTFTFSKPHWESKRTPWLDPKRFASDSGRDERARATL